MRICGWKLLLPAPLTLWLIWSPYFLGASRATVNLRLSTRSRARARSNGRGCRAERSPPASCARLQSRQFLADAGDARADQGLVTDKLEGQADQDRRESREPRPLCYLPDGRGRHRTANVPIDFAAYRGATAAATTSASVRRSMSCIQEQRQKECVQMPGKIARSDPRPSFGLPELLVAIHTSRRSCCRA